MILSKQIGKFNLSEFKSNKFNQRKRSKMRNLDSMRNKDFLLKNQQSRLKITYTRLTKIAFSIVIIAMNSYKGEYNSTNNKHLTTIIYINYKQNNKGGNNLFFK